MSQFPEPTTKNHTGFWRHPRFTQPSEKMPIFHMLLECIENNIMEVHPVAEAFSGYCGNDTNISCNDSRYIDGDGDDDNSSDSD